MLSCGLRIARLSCPRVSNRATVPCRAAQCRRPVFQSLGRPIHSRRCWLVAAQLEDEGELNVDDKLSQQGGAELDLPLPAQRYQKVLSMAEKKTLRTKSNTLAKDKTIQRIICGQNGITQSFLNACTDVLGKYEFLRVKLGEGAGLVRHEAAHALERHLDAVVVHQIGFTITLYRQPGLPRPSNCPPAVSTNSSPEEGMADAAATQPQVPESRTKRIPDQRTSAKSAQRAADSKAAAKKQPKGPPEFSVV